MLIKSDVISMAFSNLKHIVTLMKFHLKSPVASEWMFQLYYQIINKAIISLALTKLSLVFFSRFNQLYNNYTWVGVRI